MHSATQNLSQNKMARGLRIAVSLALLVSVALGLSACGKRDALSLPFDASRTEQR